MFSKKYNIWTMTNQAVMAMISFVLLVFSSCKKDEVTFDPVPGIEFVSISPAVANEYTDPVTITIKYTDGDGDLGENNANVKNCFVHDNRIGITYSFRIEQLAPDQADIQITGNLNIDIGGLGITDNSNQQNATFSIYVVDRAGHQSNSVTTSAVSIRKP